MNVLGIVAAILTFGAAQVASGGSITGTLRLTEGGPAAGVRVGAMVVPGVRRVAAGASELASITQTDSDGHYRLADLPPGRYFIVAGPVAFPDFYPGTASQQMATVVTVSRGSPALSGADFAIRRPVVSNPTATSAFADIRLQARLVTEDGNPLPDADMRVVSNVGYQAQNLNRETGTLVLRIPKDTRTQLDVVGLPPGYFLKSVVYGSKDYGPGAVLINGLSPPNLDLKLGYLPIASLASVPKVSVRGKVMNPPRELNVGAMSLSLTSTIPNGPAAVGPLQPDLSFEFSSVPAGAYRVKLRDSAGRVYDIVGRVFRENVADLIVDLRNNPFPEFEGIPSAHRPFAGGKKTELTGVVTEKLTLIHPPDQLAYFRMEVKDESTGIASRWAIHVALDWQVPKIVVGETLTVPGTLNTDGTNRFSADPF